MNLCLLTKNFFLGNKKIGGIEFPKALTANPNVTSVSLSPDVSQPTILEPFLAKTLFGFWTVVIPTNKICV